MKKDQFSPGYKDIDSYINSQPIDIRPTLEKLRQAIKKAIPAGEEVISYQIPAFRLHGIVVFFASFKKHYSIFVRPVFLKVFKDELIEYKTSKSAVNFPLNYPVPVRLITKIVKYIARQNHVNSKIKK